MSVAAAAEVTDWGMRLLLTAATLAVMVLLVGLMARGWRGRARGQADIPAPPLPHTSAGDVVTGPFAGRYLASTTAGDWLDRVVVHGLGVPSRAALSVRTDGVLLAREGAPDVFVPAPALRGVRLDRGIAGAVYEHGGVVVLQWQLGDRTLDTGFRSTDPDQHDQIVASTTALASTPSANPGPGGQP